MIEILFYILGWGIFILGFSIPEIQNLSLFFWGISGGISLLLFIQHYEFYSERKRRAFLIESEKEGEEK